MVTLLRAVTVAWWLLFMMSGDAFSFIFALLSLAAAMLENQNAAP
jgi:hypothetical protein